MRFGIIGCGLMGRQRAASLARMEHTRLAAAFDVDRQRAASLNAREPYAVEGSIGGMLARNDLDALIVAVPHHMTREVAVAALESGRHVLCEKPLGRTVEECDAILEARRPQQLLAAGFNYRFYPAVQQARQWITAGEIGAPTHMRFVLGHGGRPGMEREWKTSRELCGGGALLDPGIHVIDLVRYFLGEVDSGRAVPFRSFWNVDVEDNVFAELKTVTGGQAQIHISITEWKSRFAIDIFGTDGSLHVRGRSGFYGAQRIAMTRRWEWRTGSRASQEPRQYPAEDTSFEAELRAFVAVAQGEQIHGLATAQDGRRALEIVEDLYAKADGISDAGDGRHLHHTAS